MLLVSAGMRRSGSTLQYNLARDLLEATDRGTGEGYISHEDFPSRASRLEGWVDDDRYHLVKSHVFPEDVPGSDRDGVRFLHVYRDLRSVAASMKQKWGTSDDALLDSLKREVDRDRALGGRNAVLVQRYENFVDDLPAGAAEVASYLGLDAEEPLLRTVAERNDFQRTREAIQRLQSGPRYWINRLLSWFGVRRDYYDEGSLLHADHITSKDPLRVRWHEALSDREQEAIEREFSGWLKKRGYL